MDHIAASSSSVANTKYGTLLTPVAINPTLSISTTFHKPIPQAATTEHKKRNFLNFLFKFWH